jgi:hypothetical protein
VTAVPAVITIGMDPYIEVGPVAAAYDTRRRGLEPDRLYAIGLIVIVGALVALSTRAG